MSLPSSVGSVPSGDLLVKTCVECWHETNAVLALFGREVCPDCYAQAETDHEERQAQQWEAASFGAHDQMSSLKSVLVGMGL